MGHIVNAISWRLNFVKHWNIICRINKNDFSYLNFNDINLFKFILTFLIDQTLLYRGIYITEIKLVRNLFKNILIFKVNKKQKTLYESEIRGLKKNKRKDAFQTLFWWLTKWEGFELDADHYKSLKFKVMNLNKKKKIFHYYLVKKIFYKFNIKKKLINFYWILKNNNYKNFFNLFFFNLKKKIKKKTKTKIIGNLYNKNFIFKFFKNKIVSDILKIQTPKKRKKYSGRPTKHIFKNNFFQDMWFKLGRDIHNFLDFNDIGENFIYFYNNCILYKIKKKMLKKKQEFKDLRCKTVADYFDSWYKSRKWIKNKNIFRYTIVEAKRKFWLDFRYFRYRRLSELINYESNNTVVSRYSKKMDLYKKKKKIKAIFILKPIFKKNFRKKLPYFYHKVRKLKKKIFKLFIKQKKLKSKDTRLLLLNKIYPEITFKYVLKKFFIKKRNFYNLRLENYFLDNLILLNLTNYSYFYYFIFKILDYDKSSLYFSGFKFIKKWKIFKYIWWIKVKDKKCKNKFVKYKKFKKFLNNLNFKFKNSLINFIFTKELKKLKFKKFLFYYKFKKKKKFKNKFKRFLIFKKKINLKNFYFISAKVKNYKEYLLYKKNYIFYKLYKIIHFKNKKFKKKFLFLKKNKLISFFFKNTSSSNFSKMILKNLIWKNSSIFKIYNKYILFFLKKKQKYNNFFFLSYFIKLIIFSTPKFYDLIFRLFRPKEIRDFFIFLEINKIKFWYKFKELYSYHENFISLKNFKKIRNFWFSVIQNFNNKLKKELKINKKKMFLKKLFFRQKKNYDLRWIEFFKQFFTYFFFKKKYLDNFEILLFVEPTTPIEVPGVLNIMFTFFDRLIAKKIKWTISAVLKILRGLIKKQLLNGFKFLFAGRFLRKDRASFIWKRIGRVSSSERINPISYFSKADNFRYGRCCLKVWLEWSQKKKKFKN